MKQGKSLRELAIEVQRQDRVKRDYLVENSAIHMRGGSTVDVDGVGAFKLNPIAHAQIGQYLEIPTKYYEKMRTFCPSLLDDNVNHWFGQNETDRRMLRTLDGRLRAFLSDRYRRIDNSQILETVLPIISEMDGAEVKSCEITDSRIYLKVVNPRIQTDVKVGDTVQSGLIISNSEVGLGSVSVSPLIYRLVCSNGMVAQSNGIRKYHIGKANESDDNYGIYQDDTIEADDTAFLLKLRDAVKAAVSQVVFEKIVQQMRDASDAKIEPITVPKVVELTSKQYRISDYESENVLGYLIEGGDLSLYGLSNAVTRYAQDVDSYDRSTELEVTGYRILTTPPKMWNEILSTARKDV